MPRPTSVLDPLWKQLADLRRAQNISLARVAADAAMTRESVGLVLSGGSGGTVHSLRAIALALGMEPVLRPIDLEGTNQWKEITDVR